MLRFTTENCVDLCRFWTHYCLVIIFLKFDFYSLASRRSQKLSETLHTYGDFLFLLHIKRIFIKNSDT